MEWPELNYSEWKPTYETLHRWLQIIGKLRLCKSPWVNHSWSTTLYLSSRGLTTSAIPLEDRILTVEMDLIDHKVLIDDSTGKHMELPLMEEPVAAFYHKFIGALEQFDVVPTFDPSPNEVSDAIPFMNDMIHRTYNKEQAHRCFQVMVRVSNILQDFRSDFIGKSSPVHFFWGSFDLAVTRFSGRRAPEHPGGVPHLSDQVVKEAYSHEVISCGFWPGNEAYPQAAFYAYAYPEPQGFAKARVTPAEAYYHKDLKEFILDYSVVRKSTDPAAIIRSFFNSAYRAGSNLANWDRDMLEVSPYLAHMKEHLRSSFADQAIRQ